MLLFPLLTPFIVSFSLIHVVTSINLVQSTQLRHNQSSTTTQLPHVNTVIFKSYLCHFSWSCHTKNLAASILNHIFFSLATFISILVRLFNSVLNVRSLTSHLRYTARANLALTTLTYLLFLKLESLFHYLLGSLWSNSFWILSHQHPSLGFSNLPKEKNCWEETLIF